MAQASLDKLVSKLEQVEAKLTRIENLLSGGAGSSGAGAGSSSAAVAAWDALISAHIPAWVEASRAIAPEVGQIAELFEKALGETRSVIAKAADTKKPADIMSFVGGVAAAMNAVGDFEAKQRKSQFPNHLKAVSNGVTALGWVAASPAPAPTAKEQGETAFMYTDRVLTTFKGKDEIHATWARQLVEFLKELPPYIKANHTTGLSFKP